MKTHTYFHYHAAYQPPYTKRIAVPEYFNQIIYSLWIQKFQQYTIK